MLDVKVHAVFMAKYSISMAAARLNAGLTQGELAEKLNLSKQTIINWEAGNSFPDPAHFIAFCKICKVPADLILFEPHK